MLAQLHVYMRVGILLTCRKHLHDRIISLKGEECAHNISLTRHLLLNMSVPSQESELPFICVLGVSIFLLDIGPFLVVWYFLFFVSLP